VKLFEDQLKPMDPHRYHDGVRLVAADEAPRLVAVVQDRLCAVDFSDLKLDRPIILARPTGPLLVEPDKETTFDLKADGGKPPYRYSLTVEVPGVTMDEKTGRITIKPNELSPAAVKQLANTIMRTDRYRGGLVSARFGAYRQEAAGVFKKLLGRDPAGTPMALTLSVQAEDKERMNTRIRLVAIVDVPKGAIDAAVEQQKADEAKERAARLPAQPDDDAPVTNSTSDQKRIKELEAEVEALNAKVDLLTDLLKARLAPATQP
jgi:hypothetical protein